MTSQLPQLPQIKKPSLNIKGYGRFGITLLIIIVACTLDMRHTRLVVHNDDMTHVITYSLCTLLVVRSIMAILKLSDFRHNTAIKYVAAVAGISFLLFCVTTPFQHHSLFIDYYRITNFSNLYVSLLTFEFICLGVQHRVIISSSVRQLLTKRMPLTKIETPVLSQK